MSRHEPRYKRTFTDQAVEPCRRYQFDQSNMDEIEFERLLLWSYQFPIGFTKQHDAELTAEVYRRAAQVRATRVGRTPEDQRKPVQPLEVSVGEIQWEDGA